jgi:pimeloyl-ACP methyl ester carboxylesterase
MRMLLKISVWLLALIALIFALALAAFWAPDRSVEELKARWAPPPSVFIEVDGMQVHMRDEGVHDDPLPIVLIHGTSASLHTWDGWVEALKATRRVIRLDLPAFGLTGPFADNDYTLPHYARFMHAFLDRLGVQRCVLAGNSFGGQVAMVTLLAKPERVEKLILVDSSGYPLVPASIPIGFRMMRMPVISSLAKVILPRRVVEDSTRNVYGDPSRVTPELVDRYYETTLREGNRRALGERIRQIEIDAITDRIPQIRVPTLILWGGRDRLIPLDAGRRFAKDIADSRLQVFDDLGHVPHEEDPRRTAAAVQAFLQPPK